METLGSLLKKYRDTRDISQQRVAEAVRVSQQAIQQFESGQVTNPRYLPRLIRFLEGDRDEAAARIATLNAAIGRIDSDIQSRTGGNSTVEKGVKASLNEQRAVLKTDLDENLASLKVFEEIEELLIDNQKHVSMLSLASVDLDKPDRLFWTKIFYQQNTIPILQSEPSYLVTPDNNLGERLIVTDQQIGEVSRPEPLLKSPFGFAVYYYGSEMYPVFQQGDLLLCNPGLPFQVGDDLLLSFPPESGKDPLVARCVAATVGQRQKLTMKTFSPEAEAEVEGACFTAVIVGAYRR